MPELVPAGFRLRPDPTARLLNGSSLLAGGSPLRILRLTPAGAKLVSAWWAGEPVSGSRNARALARRLLDAGIAHPVLDGAGSRRGRRPRPVQQGPADVTVVIPVRDRAAQLATCLEALSGPGQPPVVVVDDGSDDPAAIAAVAEAAGALLLRRPVNGGPGAARNTGVEAVDTALVAFIDSDCAPRPGWLETLLPHFADPAVGAVAPRIVPHAESRTWLGRYEGAASTLDMGPRAGIVSQRSRISYVPTAALVVRKAALGAGFATDIRAGEDVDFIWRIAASGWRTRYEPAAAVGHQHRTRLRPWFSRRMHYGTSAAVLEQRHPGAVRPLYVSGWTALAWLAVAAGRPAAGAAITGAATALLARRLGKPGGRGDVIPPGTAWLLAARLAGGGTVASARPLGSAISRTWWPAALPAAIAVRRLRAPLAALVLAPPLLDWLDRRPPLNPAHYVAGRLLGDLAYSIGVWRGCVQRRTVQQLLPSIGQRRGTALLSRSLPEYPGGEPAPAASRHHY
ncbi:MAG TPA: mycofactocin biosynthesis glycosyltransferase MftF [Streptosporangiaceae bacterium]